MDFTTSARDGILATMNYAAEWFEGTYEEHEAECVRELDAYRDAILSEVAEKIRNHDWRECCSAPCTDGPDAAADFIDPEVQA